MTNPTTTRRTCLVAGSLLASGLVSGALVDTAEKYPRNLTKDDVDRWMKELSNWGKWGPDDQAGTVNLITPAKRKAAAALVKDGVSISLSVDADLPKEGPTSGPPAGAAPAFGGPPGAPGASGGARGGSGGRGAGGGPNRTTWTLAARPPGPTPRPAAAFVLDTISTSYHGTNTTHFDALSHIYYQGKMYNGFPQSAYTDRGAGKDDVMAFKEGIFTRGVLFDIPRLKGVPYLGDDEAIYVEDLEAWEKKAGFRLESGDAMLFRTGRWVRAKEKGIINLNQTSPGLYASTIKWMRERGVAVLGGDVDQDVMPSRVEGVSQPMHQMALNTLGTPLLDNCNLDALSEAAAQRRRWTFLLTVNPMRIPGATGGPVNPIAVF